MNSFIQLPVDDGRNMKSDDRGGRTAVERTLLPWEPEKRCLLSSGQRPIYLIRKQLFFIKTEQTLSSIPQQ